MKDVADPLAAFYVQSGLGYPEAVLWSAVIIYWVSYAINIALAITALIAFGDALFRRADLFPAIGRLSKGAWLGILGASLFVLVFGGLFDLLGPLMMFLWIPAAAAIVLYLVDTRRRLRDAATGYW